MKKKTRHFDNSSACSMRERIRLFKQDFYEYSNMQDQNIRELIRIYDRNINVVQHSSNPSIAIIGGLIVWGTGLFFNASAGR